MISGCEAWTRDTDRLCGHNVCWDFRARALGKCDICPEQLSLLEITRRRLFIDWTKVGPKRNVLRWSTTETMVGTFDCRRSKAESAEARWALGWICRGLFVSRWPNTYCNLWMYCPRIAQL